MKIDTITSKNLIFPITSLPQQAKMLIDKGKQYEITLKEILKYNYYDEDVKLPPIKEICENKGISRDKFRKNLVQIFEDLKNMINDYKQVALK